MKPARRGRFWNALLALPPLVFLGLYASSLDHEFVWTDQGEIEHGILIRPRSEWFETFSQPMYPELSSLSPTSAQPYYRPLQVLVASAIDLEFGKRPRAFRTVNLALGALTMALFTGLAWWLFRDPLPAALAGALAAAHPVGIEMYVWVAGLSGALAHVAVLGSLLAAALALSTESRGARAALAGLSCVALVAGLLSKESAVVTPALLLAIYLCRSPQVARQSHAGLPASSFALGLLATQLGTALAYALWWRPHVIGETLSGAAPIAGSSAVQVFTSFASWPRQLAWLFFPNHSSTSDVVRVAASLADPIALLGLLLALGSLAFGWRLLRSGQPVAALGIAWIWIAFLPTSGLIPLTHMRAERYLALSVFGAALLVASLLPRIAKNLAPRAPDAVAAGLGVCLVLALGQRSAARIPEWRSNLTLFSADVERDPLYREGYYILATTLAEQGRFEEAAARLAELRALAPHFAGLSSFLRADDAFLLQCRVNRELERNAETLELFGAELNAESEALPASPELFLCGAHALASEGRFEEAREIALRVRDLHPSARPRAALLVAEASIGLGNVAQAEREFAAIPAESLRGPELDAERRRVKALLREQRTSN